MLCAFDLKAIVDTINSVLSDYVLLILLVGTGIYFTIRTRFVQFRGLKDGFKSIFSRREQCQKGGISSFQALATAIAAQVGTGNIVGACGAILIGGPGAIFWMWVIAFFGMATIYAEAVLAQETREKDPDGSVRGGPVYYIKRVFKGKLGKFLAGFFAVAAVIALGIVGGMVQSNSISANFNTAFGVPEWVTGLVVGALVAVIVLGGATRIAKVAEKIVPIMAILYLLGGIVVLAVNVTTLPETFAMIFREAFTPHAVVGAGFGAVIKSATQGAKRGLFSNEAGMGSTPHAHALAEVKSPHEQGSVAMVGVFIDAFVVLTITALVVINVLYVNGEVRPDATFNSANMAQMAFGSVFGTEIGNIFVAICLLFFAFTTILGWNLFGKINFEHLFGKKSLVIYSIISIIGVVVGSFLGNDTVWAFSDLFNQLMVIPNVMALIALSSLVVNACKKKPVDKEPTPPTSQEIEK